MWLEWNELYKLKDKQQHECKIMHKEDFLLNNQSIKFTHTNKFNVLDNICL